MKRTLKWIAVLVGIPLLAAGLLAFDSRRRAIHAIEAHEQRLHADIAALRARRRLTGLLEGRDLSGIDKLPCPHDAFKAPAVYEAGHGRVNWVEAIRSPKAPVLRPQQVLTILAVTERAYHEGGISAYNARQYFDTRTLDALQGVLLQPGTGAEDLKEIQSALQALEAARPSIQDVFEGEHLLDRIEVLRIIPTRSDNHVMLQQKPGATEGCSWRVLVAKALNQLEDRYREVLRSKSASLEEWSKKAQEIEKRIQAEGSYSRSNVTYASMVIDAERFALARWKFVEVATALARYQAEKGRAPASLSELAPDYLVDPPINPYDGKPFDYREGTLRTVPSATTPQFEWSVRVR